MRNVSSNTRKTLGSVAVVASLALAAPVVATGTAHAAVKVNLTGTASCARYGDSSPTELSVKPAKGTGDTDELRGEEVTEPYAITLTQIPKNGTSVTATVTCVDSDNDTHTYSKTFPVMKPVGGGAVSKNLK